MALTNATTLADYGAGIGTQGTTLKVDANNKRVGVGTTNPQGPEGSLQVGTGITFFGNTGIVSAIGGKFSGDFTVGGVLTFEDVTNIDAVGIITAQSHVSIADSILHTGDTNTASRFPAADTFTVETGGSEALRVDSSQRFLMGRTSSRAVASRESSIQVHSNDSSKASISIRRFATNSVDNRPPRLVLGRSGSDSDDFTVVADDNRLGEITFAGADGTDLQTEAANIRCEVDGSPGSDDMPGRLVFTTNSGTDATTERLRLDSGGQVLINGGNDARSNFHGGGTTYRLQVESTSFETSAPAFICNSNTAGHGPHVTLARSRGTSVGSNTIVQDGDVVGVINFQGNDGTHFENVARIRAEIDGTPGANDMPGRLTFFTVADGGVSPTERLRITSAGRILKGITTARDNFANNASGANVDFQIEGTDFPSSSLSLVRNSNDANDCSLIIGKTRATSTGGSTVVQAGDDLGDITFAGADGTSLQHGANIVAEVQSGVGNDDMPTDLIFKTNSGTTSTTERLRIDSSGRVLIGSDTTQTAPTASRLQVAGSDFGTSSIRMTRFESGTSGPSLIFAHSRGSEGSQTALGTADEYGKIRFYGHDGTDFDNFAAEIKASVDTTPGTDDMPGRLSFSTSPDGSNTTTERMRIHSGGTVTIPNGITLGTTIASTDAANTLHDYEEGTWTPSFGIGSVTVTDAVYTKVGRLVTVTARVTMPTTTNTATVNIGGLPFTPDGFMNSAMGGIVGETDLATTDRPVACVESSGNSIRFRQNGGTALTFANLSQKTLRWMATYFTDQ